MRALNRFLDWLLGRRCCCGLRVYSRDARDHYAFDCSEVHR